MPPKRCTADDVLRLARSRGVIRVRDLTEMGIHPEYLRRLCASGVLEKAGRGLYVPADSELPADFMLLEASRRVPHGVVCLVSALRFHEIGTQLPREIWMMIDRRAARPRVARPRMRFFRASGEAFRAGVQHHRIAGSQVAIYEPAKTIADCFKYRNKIGLDIAVEALRDALRQRRARVNDILRYARICRVDRVMRPYLEAMV